MTANTRRVITVLYPNKPGVTFNFDYYRDHHATLIERRNPAHGADAARLSPARRLSTRR
jgi:hypothetical protein